jgi:hypothetical protein
MQKLIKSWVLKVLTIAIVVMAVGIQSSTVFAASVTSLSDNMSRLKASTASNHTIQFVTPTGLTAGQTITLTFSSDFTGVASIVFGDVDLATAATCSGFVDRTLAASPSGATWGVGSSGQVVTLTSGTGTITAGHCVQIEIGTNATSGVTGTNQISNGSSDDDDTVAIGGTFADSGSLSVDIITDDQVSVTATVSPSITFSISDNTIGFGTLSAAASHYATGDTLGDTSEQVAHTLAAGTNATSGYVMYVLGDTLKSGANDITAIGGTAATPATGTEQFGFRMTASGGSGAVLSPYNDGTPKYAYNATTTSQDDIASAAGASATTTYNVYYLANIASNTEAGAYSTTLTYTATATF